MVLSRAVHRRGRNRKTMNMENIHRSRGLYAGLSHATANCAAFAVQQLMQGTSNSDGKRSRSAHQTYQTILTTKCCCVRYSRPSLQRANAEIFMMDATELRKDQLALCPDWRVDQYIRSFAARLALSFRKRARLFSRAALASQGSTHGGAAAVTRGTGVGTVTWHLNSR